MIEEIGNAIGKLYLNGILLASIIVLRLTILKVYKRRKQISGIDNFIVGINTMSLIIIVVLLFLTVLQLFNVDVKNFFTSISIIAVGLAILFKDYISNAINGMTLMFNSNIEIGDYVKIDNQKGIIKNLSLLNVQMESEEGDLVLIPNNILLNINIINYTKGDTRKAQIELPLPVVMLEDIEKTEEFFKDAVKEFNHKANLNSFKMTISNIENDLVTARLSMLLHETDWETDKEIRKKWINKWASIKQKLN